MTPDNNQDRVNPENLPPAATPPIFSAAAAQAALARLKEKAAAQQAAAATPPQTAPPEAVEMTAEELAANPEEARRRFEAMAADLRKAFAAWAAAKEQQFEQLLDFAWSGEHDLASFLKGLEQERERLWVEADRAEEDVFSTGETMKLEEVHEKLADMKPVWDKLRAEGVPIEKRPLTDLPWSVQFQFQAENDPSGKDMEWWRAHRTDFADLE